MNVTAIGMDSTKLNLEELGKKRLDKKKLHNQSVSLDNLPDSFQKSQSLQKKK